METWRWRRITTVFRAADASGKIGVTDEAKVLRMFVNGRTQWVPAGAALVPVGEVSRLLNRHWLLCRNFMFRHFIYRVRVRAENYLGWALGWFT